MLSGNFKILPLKSSGASEASKVTTSKVKAVLPSLVALVLTILLTFKVTSSTNLSSMGTIIALFCTSPGAMRTEPFFDEPSLVTL